MIATPVTLAAAAALCALLATLAATGGGMPHRRARRLLRGPERRVGRATSALAHLVTAVAAALRGARPGAAHQEGTRKARVRDDSTGLPARPGDPGPVPDRPGTEGPGGVAVRRTTRRASSGRRRSDALPGRRASRTVPQAASFPASPPSYVPWTPGPHATAAPRAAVLARAGGQGRPRRGGSLRARLSARALRPETLCLPVGAMAGLLTGSLVPVVAGVAAVRPVGRALRARAERAAVERGAAAVSALCGTLAGDLRAGRPPHAALAEAVDTAGWSRRPELAAAARLLSSASRFGGDVPLALRTAARLHEGVRGLAAVAACWQVAVDGGAGLAAALDRVAAALRAGADQREDLRAQLAGPRSTAVLLALLPLFGVVLGAGLGADPCRVLLHTMPGLACLGAGAVLEWGGLAWTARIIRQAEGGPAADGHPKDPGLPRLEGGGCRDA